MDDKEKIQSFGDMVDATERLTKPWRRALIITNLLWALVFTAFILLAYLTPDTSFQLQDQDITAAVQSQTQSTGSEVVKSEEGNCACGGKCGACGGNCGADK